MSRCRLADLALVGFALLVQVPSAIALRNHDVGRHLEWYGIALMSAGPLLLWWRRRFPVSVLLVEFAITLAYDLTDQPHGPIWVALSIAFFTCMLARRRVIAWSVLVLGFAVFMGPGHALGGSPPPAEIAGIAAWMLLLGGAAEAARVGRENHLERVQARAELARRKATEERLAIARDLHDVLAHHVALISVQSGVALHLLDDHPEQARPALAAIRQASNEVLREMRGALDLLRAGDAATRHPAPDLRRVDELAANARLSGLGVDLRVEGGLQPADVPEVVSVAAYRIVQESLTNVVRHAEARHVVVGLRQADGELTVTVDDDGRGATADALAAATGSGLRGMRERATALAGELSTGRSPAGGFRVHARLPMSPLTAPAFQPAETSA
ncbi:MAG TPA: sensor histidine kinase [Acidothermaceae bacterium]|nr:sensor histidine kinase [Acidothermaceae bacterium]